jgi:hypothetical protein
MILSFSVESSHSDGKSLDNSILTYKWTAGATQLMRQKIVNAVYFGRPGAISADRLRSPVICTAATSRRIARWCASDDGFAPRGRAITNRLPLPAVA